ncbi:kelch-like protein 24 isoform X3 [Pomacea canaliculata]|nr:kelch-like protein 24 isoform X3 [Pomacea canaliculata]
MTTAHFDTCLVQRLRHLRYRGELCDTRVTVKDEEFLCHRLVLVSASDYFKANLFSADDISWDMTVDDEDVSPKSFRLLLEILYGASNLINHETVIDIITCSVHFGIDFITKHIERYFGEFFTSDNCVDAWLVAQKCKLTDLAYKSYTMAAENFDTIPENKLFSLHGSMLLILLSLQNKLSMDDICKTILRWVETDQGARAGFLCHFLPFISFPQLSREYLADLMEYRHHPFCEFIFDHLQDGIYFALKNADEKCLHSRRRILTQQSVPLDNTDITSVCLVVKATDFPLAHGPTLEAWRDPEDRYNLAPVPQNTGWHYATCTWRNELYLSGGNLLPTFFAVYRPCDNQWSVLPAFDDDDFFGREKHSLAAVNDNIYILGGLMRTCEDDKVTSPDVWKYNIKSKTWSLFCSLPEAVQETSAAVLGHRIYLFGGRNASEVDSDVVQCVDTVNNVAYIAGTLPSPTSMTRAVSNNGLIWVVLKTGQILRMWEDFNLADEIEQHLTTTKSRNTNDKPFKKPRTHDSTVSFKEVARIGVRDHFGACIGKGEITVASREPGDLVWDMNYINLSSGNVQKLPTTYIYDVQCFHLHKINIPYLHLKKRTLSVEVSSVSSRSSDTNFVASDFVASVLQTSPLWPSHARSSEPEQRGERTSGNPDQGDTTGLPKTFHNSLPIQKNCLIPENRSVSSQSSDTESVASVTPVSPIPSYLTRNSEPVQRGERPIRSQDHKNIRPNKFYTIMPTQLTNTMQSPRCLVSPMPNSQRPNLQADQETTSEGPSGSHEQRAALGSETSLQNLELPSPAYMCLDPTLKRKAALKAKQSRLPAPTLSQVFRG